MKRENEREDLIDLGAATTETRGPTFGVDDHRLGLIPPIGLSDE